MKQFISAAVVAATVACGAAIGGAPAKAAVFDVTYSGTIISGWDFPGLFGGGDLTGKSIEVIYRYDSALGSTITGTYPQELKGGPGWGQATNSLLYATISIGGTPVTPPIGHASYLAGYFAPAGSLNQYQSDAYDPFNGNSVAASVSSVVNAFGGPDLFSPFFYLVDQSNDSRVGTFQVFAGTFATGSFDINSLSVQAVSEVPIPAALPLFATILAGGGLTAWRRKRKVAAAAD